MTRFAVFRRPVLPEDEGRFHFEAMRNSAEEALAFVEQEVQSSGNMIRGNPYFKEHDYVLFEEVTQ